jgi:5-deoxy-glucuronate isomerase
MTETVEQIPSSALPNALTPDELRLVPDADGAVGAGPAGAGWRYLSFRALGLRDGEAVQVAPRAREAAVAVLAGGGVRVDLPGARPLDLAGRVSVFDDLPWAAYLPAGSEATVVGQPRAGHDRTLVAIAEAPSSDRHEGSREPVLIRPADVEVEVRGAGNATRQVNHIIRPEFPADRLLMVEHVAQTAPRRPSCD